MIKNVLAVATVVLLSACSGGSTTPSTNTVTPPADDGGGGTVTPPGGGLPPATDTKAGAYVGDFGSGEGVYVISNNNFLAGLAVAADGTANSLFGDIGTGNTFTGNLRSYFHNSSDPADQGVFGAGVAGSLADVIAPTTFNLNIVNGQTIESVDGAAVLLVGSGNGQLAPATAATVAGTWIGNHRYCGSDITSCDVLRTEITFTSSAVSGRTVIIKPDGSQTFENPISGSITEFGDVSLLSFTWNSNTYNGLVFFRPGATGQLVFLGETSATADNKTIASLLTR
jgi:hypothetical protein